MKIPAEGPARTEFLADVIRRCMASQEQRKSAYRTLKQYYLYGSEAGTSDQENVFGTINKIWPHIDQVVSFMYAQDTTRFSVDLSKSVSDMELLKVPALNGAINDTWHASDTDVRFGEALTWSKVYGSTLIKARPHRGEIIPDIVMPHDFGVWREDLPGLNSQHAFVHEYRIPKVELLYQLTSVGNPNAQSIVDLAVANLGADDNQAAQPVDRIITSAAMPTVQGEINTAVGARITYVPNLAVEMVRMYEVYVWDDDLDDFRVITTAHPSVPVYDREISRIFVARDTPFVQVCPYPMHDYFYGMSLVERLIPLQTMRNTRWSQVQHLMEMQARPPMVGSGDFTSSADEIGDTLDTAGGVVLASTQGSKMERQTPTIPDDLFAEITYIDGQFDETTGTTRVMTGQGETGVRSEGHAAQLLRVGASRAKRRALIIEDNLEELATLYLKMLKKYSKETYRADDGSKFLASQFTDKFIVKVDAHSSSPVFMQDQTQIAFELYKARAITREDLIEMLPVAMKDLLKLKLKTKIEPAEARQAAQQQQNEKVKNIRSAK